MQTLCCSVPQRPVPVQIRIVLESELMNDSDNDALAEMDFIDDCSDDDLPLTSAAAQRARTGELDLAPIYTATCSRPTQQHQA